MTTAVGSTTGVSVDPPRTAAPVADALAVSDGSGVTVAALVGLGKWVAVNPGDFVGGIVPGEAALAVLSSATCALAVAV